MSTFQMIDTAEVAKILGVSVGTVRNWRSSGEGPASYKIQGSVRYELGEVEAWARKRHDPVRTPTFTLVDLQRFTEAVEGEFGAVSAEQLVQTLTEVTECEHQEWAAKDIYKEVRVWFCEGCKVTLPILVRMPCWYGWSLPCGAQLAEPHHCDETGECNFEYDQDNYDRLAEWLSAHYDAEDGVSFSFECTGQIEDELREKNVQMFLAQATTTPSSCDRLYHEHQGLPLVS